MRFPYDPIIVRSPETGEPDLIFRPSIPITIIGPVRSVEVLALVDSGADNTIVPRSVADYVGIALARGVGPPSTAFGGQSLSMEFGDICLQLEQESTSVRWSTRVQVYDFGTSRHEGMVLGHQGFLDYFTVILDGELCELTVRPNSTVPVTPP